MPDINKLYNEFQNNENMRFLMITLDDDFNKAIDYVNRKDFNFKIYQFASAIPFVYQSQIIPTTFVLSPSGDVVVKKEGMAKYNSKTFKDFLRSL
jgi:hypothetical protein